MAVNRICVSSFLVVEAYKKGHSITLVGYKRDSLIIHFHLLKFNVRKVCSSSVSIRHTKSDLLSRVHLKFLIAT